MVRKPESEAWKLSKPWSKLREGETIGLALQAAARYNQRTGSWEAEVIKDTWLPVPPAALAPIPSPDGNYHVCEYAGTIRCFFQPGQVRIDPLEREQQTKAAHRPWGFPSWVHVLGKWPSRQLTTSVAAP